jgi:hypothetical protein
MSFATVHKVALEATRWKSFCWLEHLKWKHFTSKFDLDLAWDVCLRCVQSKYRKKSDDVWKGPYMMTRQLGDTTFQLG